MMKKILSLILCLSLLLCAVSLPTYADELNTSSVIDNSEIPDAMMDMFNEHDVDVDDNTIVSVVELSDGYVTANGIAVSNTERENSELSIFAGLSISNSNGRSADDVQLSNLVERSNNIARSTYTWSYKPASQVVKTTITYIYNTTDSGLRLYRPQSAEFTVSSTSVTYALVTYSCKGQLYNYPAKTKAGSLYQHNITVTKNNPSANTTYSKTNALNSSYRIAAREGSPLEGCGQYIAVDCRVNGTLYEYTANITYDI